VDIAGAIGTKAGVREEVARAEARWIWIGPESEQETGFAPGTVYFRKEFDLPTSPSEASFVVTCDNQFTLFANGAEIASGSDHTRPKHVDLRPHLRAGKNVLAVKAVNRPANPKPRNEEAPQNNPAGLFLLGRIRHPIPDPKSESESAGAAGESVLYVVSDESWDCSTAFSEGWTQLDFARRAEGEGQEEGKSWEKSLSLGGPDAGPWKLADGIVTVLANSRYQNVVRAALLNADPLTTALGRPNREQVVTSRASTATTLQALELTNGTTLARRLAEGAKHLIESGPDTPADLAMLVYQRALGRPPTREETELAEGLMGDRVDPEEAEDLLWAIAMLPEFQLIH
jgi:hypothetical protein